jgi:hypothetical protein
MGLIIAALAQKIPYPGSVELVEALAARRAVDFALEIGTWKIEIEGDSELIIKAINRQAPIFTLMATSLMISGRSCQASVVPFQTHKK